MKNQITHTPGPWIVDDRHVHPSRGLTYPRGVEPDCLELVQHADGMTKQWEADGAERDTKMHGLAVCLNNRAGDLIRAAIAKAKGQP